MAEVVVALLTLMVGVVQVQSSNFQADIQTLQLVQVVRFWGK